MEPSKRKIVTRSPSRTVRIINLPPLLPAAVEAESSLEADFVQRAALLQSIAAVVAQPFRLPASPRGYTPDYLLTFTCCDLKAVVEIKIATKVEAYRPIFNVAAAFLKEKGYTFYVVTEKVLRLNEVDQRVSRILRYAKSTYPVADCNRTEALLASYPCGLPIGTLRRKAGVSRELLFHLIAHRRVTTGRRLLIDDSAIIRSIPTKRNTEGNPLETALGVTPWPVSSERSKALRDPDSPHAEG